MDQDDLISNVRLNPPIWDKRLREHSDRYVVDACWKNISEQMGVEEAVLRKKWKYLRDQFRVECSKVKKSRSGDAAETATEPKWGYYKPLLFLKDIVKPKVSSSNLKSKSPTVKDEFDYEQEEDITLYDLQETEDVDVSIPKIEVPDGNTTVTQVPAFDQPADQPLSQHRKRRRTTANRMFNEDIQLMENEKLDAIQSALQGEPDNENDLLFFRSLLPFVSKIPIEKKLRFRSRIQEVVEEFAFTEGS